MFPKTVKKNNILLEFSADGLIKNVKQVCS